MTSQPPETSKSLTVEVDGRPVRWEVQGPFDPGDASVMVELDEDLSGGTSWDQDGYTVVDWPHGDSQIRLRSGITEIVEEHLLSIGADPGDDFGLETYHTKVDDETHRRFTSANRCFFPLERFPLPIPDLEEVVSDVVNRRVRLMEAPTRRPSFVIRVVRPDSQDHSPPHRDHWLQHLRSSVAVYLPVAGSTSLSSLPLVPGSHRWPEDHVERTESHGVANGVQYGLPVVSAARSPIRMERPVLGSRQMLVFSPYLVHGSAINLETALTRFSLELRFR